MSTEVSAYLHPAGKEPAPQHSEYELDLLGSILKIGKIMAVANAKVLNGNFLQVVDEKKPVFLVISSQTVNKKIWKFDNHLTATISKKVRARSMLTSDVGAILIQKESNIIGYGPGNLLCCGVRIGNEGYFAGNPYKSDLEEGGVNMISFEDLLLFVSGETSWSDLKERSCPYDKYFSKPSLFERFLSMLPWSND